MVFGGMSDAHVYGAAWLDGSESARRQVQEDNEEHPCEPRRRPRSEPGAEDRACGAARDHGADYRHSQPPRLDPPHRP